MDARLATETERELKLAFRNRKRVPGTSAFLRRTSAALSAAGIKADILLESCGRTVSGYWDTKGFDLAAAGLALRVRREGGRRVVTIKTDAAGGIDADPVLRRRSEYHAPWPEGASGDMPPDPAWFRDCPVGDLLVSAIGGKRLRPVFVTDVKRRTYGVRLADHCQLAVMLDTGWIVAGTSRLPVAEVEIELRSGAVEPLHLVAGALSREFRLTWFCRGKAERGLWLAGGPGPGTDIPALPAAPPAQSVEQTISAALHAALGRITGALRRFDRKPDDPESIHVLRVELRHIRSILELFQPDLEAERYRSLRKGIGTLFRPTADLREADMLLAAWDVFSTEPDRQIGATSDRIRDRIRQHRNHCLKAARRGIGRVRWTCALLSLAAWADGEPLAGAALPGRDKLEARLREYEQEVLDRAAVVTPEHPEDYHALRVRIKRLRSLSVLFSDDGDARRLDADVLRQLQDALGDFNDAQVNRRIADALFSHDVKAAEFLDWLDTRRARLLEECGELLEKRVRASDERL